MVLERFLQQSLDLLNETLAAAIVVVAASLLLYNLSRNLRNRVARTSAGVLACVTIVYLGDVLMSLAIQPATIEALLRFQWIGLAFIPASTFHLSDSLLATTGLPSRGRRRRVARILYAIGAALLILAAMTDTLITFVRLPDGRVSLNPGIFFGLYIAYLFPTCLIALANVWRARARCITKSTQR
ncbi:MAG TPA: histidine kinase N-terminal 7TM domain-containing protein, partial [Aggregatilineales bacterium]|nr:histidine kinase N-terminal 7TM domain-containing protein [Aggregatilineales bacterium]